MYKKLFLLFLTAVVVLSACGTFEAKIEQTPIATVDSDEVATIVAATLAAFPPPVTPASSPEQPTAQASSGIRSSYSGTSFVIPDGLGSNAVSESIAAVPDSNDVAGWTIASAYISFTVADYPVKNKYFLPMIRVYPAQDYAAVSTSAAESIRRLQAFISDPGMDLTNQTSPIIPFVNAGPTFQAHATLIKFQNGTGIRMITQYDQAPLPISNIEMFYLFEGLTSDNKYYIIATLPINSPILAVDDTPDASIPTGGIPFDFTLNQSNLQAYYKSVTENLESTNAETFTPNLTTLDALIQSINVTAP